VIGKDDNTVEAVNVRTGEVLWGKSHDDFEEIMSVSISKGGQQLVAIGDTHRLRVFSLVDGEEWGLIGK